MDVRFGSLADICAAKSHGRFTPESGHVQCNSECPLCAKSGHDPAIVLTTRYKKPRLTRANLGVWLEANSLQS
jgi:hypothetical protein